jgi:hypothetical protein
LAHLYARTPAGNFALGPGSDFETFLDALRHFGVPHERVHHLVGLINQCSTGDGDTPLEPATQSSVFTALRDPAHLDRDLLRELGDAVAAINSQVGSAPFVRLQLQLGPIVETCRRLLRIDQSPPSELRRLAVDAYALSARLSFESRDDEAAMTLYMDAVGAAERLGDPSCLAAVRTSYTMVTLHGTDDLDAARKLARAATVDAHRGSSYAARARAHAVHAEVCARAGQSSEAVAALDRARKTVSQLAVDDPHGGFTADHLDGFEGLCALYAGDAERAHDRLDRSVRSLSQPREAVQRGIVSTDLALARLRLGDPAACVDLLHEAVDITAATGGRVSTKRVWQARRALRSLRTEAFLSELDDHIHDSLLGR